ncbi:hypothetical protein CEUSTIGMA_g12169.t1 [Chlamydomonas eustigma]|uniref:Uncharacterized protein n=1 Tax=Chlamydomonas eustigma TaxID=1157962 RepID=A0A250XNU8_9CHLO|nr:hypothetical protein CEUSTIGMA_g12169.t1 [Chlamydomonas eustigma]|eukprot:GAX84747.1 hypothetical protein CEUSTIGMA_g12169.t1 [Chlamydomonas eustigma]
MMLQCIQPNFQKCSKSLSNGVGKSKRSREHRLTRNSGPESSKAGLNEDVLARLKAAEEEAAMLRKELEAAKSRVSEPPATDVIEVKPKRFDSVDQRETVFTDKTQKRASWLSEADVEFFTGSAPPEESSQEGEGDPEMQQTVQKRLALGIIASLALGAFALVPTDALRLKPPKPMYFYIVPLLRIKDLLEECGPIIQDADWSTLRILLPRVTGPPNNARSNLDNVIALLDDTRTAEKATKLAAEFFEYLDSIDFNKYYDAMPSVTLTGAQNAQYAEFSGKALVVALQKLDSFLALLPSQAKADAITQMPVY